MRERRRTLVELNVEGKERKRERKRLISNVKVRRATGVSEDTTSKMKGEIHY